MFEEMAAMPDMEAMKLEHPAWIAYSNCLKDATDKAGGEACAATFKAAGQ